MIDCMHTYGSVIGLLKLSACEMSGSALDTGYGSLVRHLNFVQPRAIHPSSTPSGHQARRGFVYPPLAMLVPGRPDPGE